ncbi:LLM class F420-dependent oxidoreductase [Cellulomonas bogoriensis]|uniref:NADP oxidoreductase n=1 Tax=Cellulomonas bogoriensis 69B4 = DSM 16987 TaxID=1386082 RepID=A0A0A0BYC7_9CELL|nr:LLM class F420-dependent oxidoreductase [Cellulomonas bogoriensis]KGM13398.1 NADP oxidoreductase [Cellulomonas bogoriensis 69B4 = DSM 16987]
MRVGLHLGYWGSGPPPDAERQVATVEDLGLDSVWTAEAYGSDALTPLAWWGSRTRRLRLGTAVVQMAARTPTATAMAAMTMDHLSGGRFVLGLGVSGPQVVEGWYGSAYPRPLARTREYVDVVRQVLRREEPVTSAGRFVQLPYPGGTGLGRPLRSTVRPLRADLPIHLAAQGPRNVALAAEIAEGWLPLLVAPRLDHTYRQWLADGFARRDPRLPGQDRFEVAATVPVVVHDDVETAADAVRPFIALYVGGMGARSANFHREAVERLGYEQAAARVADLYAAGRREEAAAAVPVELVDEVALVGPRERIAERVSTWRGTVVTTLLVQGDEVALRAVADGLG